ncbi:hypothetical protein H2684_08870 [Clostridium sp. cel8]|jgi:hypothetical protein|uniref:hypothetical protein n=1 Tax=Clostridium sp. cel8 TaxID=2663123 RepID=UPI0015F59B66|nr:hypothetical protein [Clostridium sp. cel8]MBA5851416.1 hypothetical protein [Clostridium sp. cel8]
MKDNVIRVNFKRYKKRRFKKLNIISLIKDFLTNMLSSTNKTTIKDNKKIIHYSKYIS